MEWTILNWGYLLLLFIAGIITYYRKDLDFIGSALMVIMGVTIIFSAGPSWLFLILIFLVLSLAATKYKKEYKADKRMYEGKRTAKNVISNGIIAFLMAAFGGFYAPLIGGFIGAIATATADTLASEIGVLRQPRLITNFKKVPAGTDGAISVLGTVMGIIGASIIGGAAFLLGIFEPHLGYLTSNSFLASIIIAIIAGTVGCFMDSFLGATLERRNIINNEHVNLFATITGALVGIIVVILIS
ncbi:MAG: TIGR00297 family protein [Methanobacteriaceae archaeon]